MPIVKPALDPRFYGYIYDDLTGMTDEELVAHYKKYGKSEGRKPSWNAFVKAYPRLKILDLKFYRELYPDMGAVSPLTALHHYLDHGADEGRLPNQRALDALQPRVAELDVDFYRKCYSDAADLSDSDVKKHYLANGIREKRAPTSAVFLERMSQEPTPLPADFSAKEYLVLNEDLRRHLREDWEPAFHYLRYGRWEGRRYSRKDKTITYDLDGLHQRTSSVYDMPDVVLDESRQPTVNVLVPAFDFGSMSAGFFGVFQVALFIQQCGIHVRLVMFDRFNFDLQHSREKLKNYPGMETLFDKLEVEYIGDRLEPLRVSSKDNCVATVWYSAYMARKIMNVCGNAEFLYLIQDYESVFHPSGTQYALSDLSYSFNYHALFSSKALQDYFVKKEVGAFRSDDMTYTFFNNACASVLKPKEEFVSYRATGKKKRLVFYSRPPVHRNMFELGALSLTLAVREGVFPKDEWEFIGIGLGDALIELDDGLFMRQMERMNLREYQDVISTFDIGLCLMASSHPSLLPFDLSGSGTIVVTNSFGVKDQAYFDELTTGVLVAPPDALALVEALKLAVAKVDDLDTRYANALAMKFPRSWDQTFTEQHSDFIKSVFAGTAQ